MTDVPSASGSPRSRTTRSGRCASHARSASPAVPASATPVAVRAQVRRDQRPRRLVVLDDQQPRSAVGHRRPARRAAPGAARRYDVDREPAELAPPRRRPRRPSPRRGPGPRPGRCPARAATPRRSAARDRTSRTAAPRFRAARRARRPRPGPATRPSGQVVGRRPGSGAIGAYLAALSRRFVSTSSKWTASARTGGAPARTRARRRGLERRREARRRSAGRVLDVEDLEARPERAALDPAHVQQVAHEPVEPIGLEVDRLEPPPGARSSVQVDLGIHQAAGGGTDRRERRPQVVRHGVQERVLERLALPRDLDRVRGLGQLLALEGKPDLVGGKAKQPRLFRIGQAVARAPASPRSSPASPRRPRSSPGTAPSPGPRFGRRGRSWG